MVDLTRVLGLDHASVVVGLENLVKLIERDLIQKNYYWALKTLHTALGHAATVVPQEEFMRLAYQHFNATWKKIDQHATDVLTEFEKPNAPEATSAVNMAVLVRNSPMIQDVLANVRNRAAVRTPEAFLNTFGNLVYEFLTDDLELAMFGEFDALVALADSADIR